MAYENKGAGAYAGGDSQQQQESPYTNYESKEDYVKGGYGGESYEPAVAPKQHQPDYYSPSAPQVPHDEPKPGVKEKIIEKLPCVGGGHSAEAQPAAHNQAASPPKKGVLEKVKEKISPH